MMVVNKISPPGGIKRVTLYPAEVEVVTTGGDRRVYRLQSMTEKGQPVPFSTVKPSASVQRDRESEGNPRGG